MARIVQNQKAELGGQPVPELSLSRLGFAGQRELPLFLELALAITQELAKVHAAHCVHQQIDPDHIHYHAQTQKVVLSGEISSSQKQIPSTLNPGRTSNRMLYISPEQTGRMNRTLDYRTDFYSLGTVLYELLTGKPPFVSEDMVSLIYSHIAHAPQPPHLVKPQIPVQVSHIVLKLLEKNPEDRYQTSFGLISDLELCRDQLQSSGDIPEFRLCEKDFPGHIAIPEKLYGRARDIQTLTATFQQASRGEKTLFLVSGQPGMGKSALVRELHKPVAAEGGLFLEGKAGQFQREVPYQSLVTACRQGMGIVLAKPKTEQSSWCAQLKEALGENAGLVAALIPELEILLGPSSEVLPLGPQESRLRFLETFSQFLRVFATKEHPLALFLDDLQWCDSATLELLKAILTDPRPSCLFVVGTYRENEVDAGHPLILMVQKLEREGRAVQRLELKPLHGEDIRELLGETLRTDVGSVSLLTTAVLRKTEGNPFFLHQVLYAMESQGLLRPDLDSQKWTWDEQAVADWCSPSETLVDFLVGQLKKLPPNLQDIISFAACLGVRFDLESLSFTAQQAPEVLRPALSQLADGHFLIPISSPGAVDEEIYSFLHDRIHQAASGLMEEQEQRRQHLRLGQRLWKKSAGANLAERLFEIVDH